MQTDFQSKWVSNAKSDEEIVPPVIRFVKGDDVVITGFTMNDQLPRKSEHTLLEFRFTNNNYLDALVLKGKNDSTDRVLGRVKTERKVNGVTLVRWQFPCKMNYGDTVRKFQGRTIRGPGIINFDKLGKNSFGFGYVAFSRFCSSNLCFPLQKVQLEDFACNHEGLEFEEKLIKLMDTEGWVNMKDVFTPQVSPVGQAILNFLEADDV